MTPDECFTQLHAHGNGGFPFVNSTVYQSKSQTPYLKHAGLALRSKVTFDCDGIEPFLAGFPEELGFSDYVCDTILLDDGTLIPDSTLAMMEAGKLCYYSFGPGRTKNREAYKYINHLKELGHWSVFRHANFGILIWGISRAITHELVRHDFLEPSQVSQRYTTSKTLRFVERPEYQQHDDLHHFFLGHIDEIAKEYVDLEQLMKKIQQEEDHFTGSSKTQTRKNRQQAARGVLSNVVEAPIYITANANAWRHFFDTRATEWADAEMRDLAILVLALLGHVDPIIFGDYTIEKWEEDGSYIASTPYPGA